MKLLKILLGSFAGLLVLLTWRELYLTDCFSLIIPFVVTVIIAINSFEQRILQRSCFANCYFKKSSFVHVFLTRKPLVILTSILSSTFFSISFMFQFILLEWHEVFVLAVDIFVVLVIYVFFNSKTAWFLEGNAKKVIVKKWVIWINSLIFIGFYIPYKLYTPSIPGYIENSLFETVLKASDGVVTECLFTSVLIKFFIEADAITWWLILSAKGLTSNDMYFVLALIFLIIMNGLLIVGFGKYIVQIIGYIDSRSISNGPTMKQ